MAKHGVVRTDSMIGTDIPKYLVTGIYKVSSTNTAIDNGNFVVPGAYVTNERELRLCTTPTAATAVSALAIVASEEVDKTKKYNALADFTNEAGATLRCYMLHSGDVFSVTAEAIAIGSGITPTVGTSILEAQAGVKGNLVNSATTSTTKIADLIAIEGEWYVFRVA